MYTNEIQSKAFECLTDSGITGNQCLQTTLDIETNILPGHDALNDDYILTVMVHQCNTLCAFFNYSPTFISKYLKQTVRFALGIST
jgi:hypothetical protein